MTKKQIDMLTDEADIQTDSDTPNDETIGSLLKLSREQLGVSVADIAGQLHLRPCIVEDIEADRFEQIASPIYVKGYVKNFARIVQADPKVIERCLVKQLPEACAPDMQSFSRKTTRQARDGRLMFVTYLIVFILLALLVLWWVQKSDTLSDIDFSQPTVEEIADSSPDDSSFADASAIDSSAIESTPTHLADTTLEAKDDSSSQTNVQLAGINSPADAIEKLVEHLDPIDDTSSVDLAPVTLALDNASSLLLTLSGDCWINVTDASGKVLINDLKKSGSRLNVSGESPFKLTLGAPQVVNIELDGKAVSLNDYPSGRVARLTLPSAS